MQQQLKAQPCSTSLTSKGLRHGRGQCGLAHALQHLPDFKGIETQAHAAAAQGAALQHLPDFKGIET